MIKGITMMFEMAGELLLPPWMAVTTIIWLLLFLVCYFMGGVALYRMARKGGFKKGWLAWLPGVQIFCEARYFSRPHTARRIQICLWWFWVAVLGCLTCGIWIAAGVSGASDIPIGWMKWCLGGLAVAALVLCFLIRADELTCLRKTFQNDIIWWISIISSIFCIPLQRVFLFTLTQSEEEEDEEEDDEEFDKEEEE